MKKAFLVLASILFINRCFGQPNAFPTSGNVGIGTTSPICALDIVGGSPALYLRNTTPAASVIRILPYIDGSTYFQIGSSTGWDARADLHFTSISGVTDFMTIKGTSGNIGIGTLTPQSRLAVNGTITAKQVKVTQTGWPDYVFDPSYVLPSLDSIKSFVSRHHHLPGIPPAGEIESEGLDIGDIQKKQMQQIEELTLYLSQQQKKIEYLEQTVLNQQKQIDKLKKRQDQ